MNEKKNKESWLNRAPGWLIGIILAASFLLWLAANYWKLFSSSNWGEQYYEGKSVLDLLAQPSAHTEPLIQLVVCSLVGLAVYWLRGRDK